MTSDSILVYTTESPTLTACEIARQRINQDMQDAAARIVARETIDNDEE